jgi:hypothetical protein
LLVGSAASVTDAAPIMRIELTAAAMPRGFNTARPVTLHFKDCMDYSPL